MHFLKDTLSLANIFVSTLLLLIVAGVGAGAYRKAVFENQRATNETLKELANAQEKQLATQASRLENVEKGFRVQEQRLMRVEADGERKGRLLNVAREEIRILESAMQITIPMLATEQGAHPDEHRRIMGIMGELTEYRRRSAREQDEWEQTQLSVQSYSDAKHFRDDVEKGL